MPMQKLLEHAFVHFLDIIEILSSLKKLALGLGKERKKKIHLYIPDYVGFTFVKAV